MIADDPRGLHSPDGLESGPVWFGVEPVDRRTDGLATNFNAAVIFLDRFLDRQPPVRDFGIQPELNVLAQGRMVVLER